MVSRTEGNKLILEVTPQGAVQYTYDVLGRRTTMTVAGQAPVTYQYDADSRLTQVAQGSLVIGIGYDAAGNRTSLSRANGTASLLPNAVVSATYDAANEQAQFDSATLTRGRPRLCRTILTESVRHNQPPEGGGGCCETEALQC